MKRVFILTDLYPPTWAPRMAYLTQYLHHYGWQATVFTEAVDEHLTFSDFTAPCPVHRVRLRPTTAVERALYTLGEVLFEFKERAFARAILNYTTERPDVILACSYRLFPLGAAAFLARQWDIPWVADCRDIIEQYSPGDWLPRPLKFGNIRLRPLEQLLAHRYISLRNRHLSESNHISTVSAWHVQQLARLGRPCTLIHNGYDPILFSPRYGTCHTFTIVFTGRILSLGMRDPGLLYSALEHPLLSRCHIEVHFYTDDYSMRLLTRTLSPRQQAQQQTHFFPMVTRREVPELLAKAGIVLLLGNPEGQGLPRGMVSTKLFEAIAMHKPTLMLPGTDGEAAEILKRSRTGIASDSVEEIAHYIHRQYLLWQRDGFTAAPEADDEYIAQYSRRRQARQFAHILDQVLDEQ